MIESLQEIIKKKNIDPNKLRLSIGGGAEEYSNCVIFELTEERNNTVDIIGDIRKKTEFEDETFYEVLMIHVIEHIERKYHRFVFDEIWRILKPNGRLVMGFPDFIECAKGFMENRHGKRWDLYHFCIFGRQDGVGDYHISAIERQDLITRLISSGFKNIKYNLHGINATVVAYKGEQLKEYLE